MEMGDHILSLTLQVKTTRILLNNLYNYTKSLCASSYVEARSHPHLVVLPVLAPTSQSHIQRNTPQKLLTSDQVSWEVWEL